MKIWRNRRDRKTNQKNDEETKVFASINFEWNIRFCINTCAARFGNTRAIRCACVRVSSVYKFILKNKVIMMVDVNDCVICFAHLMNETHSYKKRRIPWQPWIQAISYQSQFNQTNIAMKKKKERNEICTVPHSKLLIFIHRLLLLQCFFSSSFCNFVDVYSWSSMKGKNQVKIISYVDVSVKVVWFQSKTANWSHLSLICSWWGAQFPYTIIL